MRAEKERLTRELGPLTSAAEALKQANGRKPDKKQIPVLVAENTRLARELEYSRKDQADVFRELQKAEKENAALKRDADTLRALKTRAPDKLREAIDTANERRDNSRPPSNENLSCRTK